MAREARRPRLTGTHVVIIGALGVAIVVGVPALLLSGGTARRAIRPPAAPANSNANVIPTPQWGPVLRPASDVAVTNDVSYGPSGAELLDSYLPAAPPVAATPAVIFVHGGGWSSGDKSEWASDATDLVRSTGWAAFSINYTLDSSTPYIDEPGQVEDAVAWVKSHAATYHLDSARIGLVGDSAGGNLALLAADRGSGPPSAPGRVRTAVSWSGITDPASLVTAQRCADSWCDEVQQPLGWLLQNNYEHGIEADDPARWAATSAVPELDPSDPPALLVNSDDELVPLSQLTEMVAAMKTAGIPVTDIILPGNRHASAYNDEVWPQTLQYLERQLGD